MRTLVRSRRSTAPTGAAAGAAAGAASARSSTSGSSSPSGLSSPSGTSSPSSPMTAIVWPTGTSPSWMAIFSRTPEKSASTSCVTLSVSSSYSGSPFSTESPSDLSHLTIVPDSIPCPSRGSFTSLAIATYRATDRREHVGGVRHDVLLHHGRERNRRELRPHTLDRRVEPVERLLLHHGRDLGAEPHARDRLVRDDAAVRLLDRVDDRALVQRLQRARIDHL